MSYLYQTPIKMPRGLHYGSDYWISYSYKLKRKVCLYSLLEYSNFIELEMNPAIEYFCEQPLKIEKIENGKKSYSIFDFWAYFKDGSCEFQEIKYSSELTGSDDTSVRSQKQIEFQQAWCQNHNYKYRVITEHDLLSKQFRNLNLQILHKHLLRSSNITNNSMTKELYYNLAMKKCCIGELKELHLLDEGEELGQLAYLYYCGKLRINLDNRPLDNNTEVMLCDTKNIIY